MRRSCLIALVYVLAVAGQALAQDSDCRSPPPGGPGIPLQLDLSSLPGAAGRSARGGGAQGSVMVMVPSGPAGTCGPPRPHLPRDVLHGDPGDALLGEGPPDLLRGPGPGRVEYGPAGQQPYVR